MIIYEHLIIVVILIPLGFIVLRLVSIVLC